MCFVFFFWFCVFLCFLFKPPPPALVPPILSSGSFRRSDVGYAIEVETHIGEPLEGNTALVSRYATSLLTRSRLYTDDSGVQIRERLRNTGTSGCFAFCAYVRVCVCVM